MNTIARRGIVGGPGWRAVATVLLWASLWAPAKPASAASAPTPLDLVLERTGDRVETFWSQFSSVSCTESIEQLKLNEKGKTLNRQESAYDYVIFMQLAGKDLSVEESRTVASESRIKKKKKRPSHRTLLVTNGFPIMALVFHPRFQDRYVFRLDTAGPADGEGLIRVEFEQIAGTDPLSILRLKDHDYGLEWKGSAWIDPESGSIHRIRSSLREPVEEVGLEALDSDVLYTEVSFRESPNHFWLPNQARIEARTAHQHWRNVHLFSDYKKFTVDTEVSIAEVN